MKQITREQVSAFLLGVLLGALFLSLIIGAELGVNALVLAAAILLIRFLLGVFVEKPAWSFIIGAGLGAILVFAVPALSLATLPAVSLIIIVGLLVIQK